MGDRVRPYLYYDAAISICPTCYRKVDGKILFEDGRAYLDKRCPEHGRERVLIAEDAEFYRWSRESFNKPSEMPRAFGTQVRHGCPYDCGLCTDHEQHSCLTLIEITDHCNLECPVCYASSGPKRPGYRSLAEVEAMLDALVRGEGEPDVVQISGGEPTLHPELFAILDAARRRPIRHLMINTNGLRIAREAGFAEKLARYAPGFEVYLQFDSLEPDSLQALRGANLAADRLRALDRLDALGISTTLVVTLAAGVNDDQIGRIIDFALTRPSVRGVTFQPVQMAGRIEGFDPARDRLTLTGVRSRLLAQSPHFTAADILPVPCHPDAIAMAYALKLDGKVVPLTRFVDPALLLSGPRSTIVFEQEETLRAAVTGLFSTGTSPVAGAERLKDLLCCLPRVDLPQGLGYGNVFRIIILAFMDAYSLDVRSVRKSCVHIVHPRDGRIIPFETYNLFYRDDLETTRLDPLRAQAQGLVHR